MKISVAEIVNTHGIKGALKVKSFSDNDKRFDKGSKLILDGCTLTIKSAFKHKGSIVLKFEEFNDINEVEKFIGHELTIDEADLGDLKEDEYYLFDLVGLEVF